MPVQFKQRTRSAFGLGTITIVSLINTLFLLSFFFMLSSRFTAQSAITVKLPKTIMSDLIKNEKYIITITKENIIYLNNKVVNLTEIKTELSKDIYKKRPVLIQADRRASVGRIVDVWDLCRNLGIEQINIATNQKRQ